MRFKGIAVTIALIGVGLIALSVVTDFLVDWLWFSAVGYFSVFRTVFLAKAVLFLTVFIVSTLVLFANAALALRLAKLRRSLLPATFGAWAASGQPLPEALLNLIGPASAPRRRYWGALAVAALLGFLIAVSESGSWALALRFIHRARYGLSDPLFERDIGFYLFSLPAYVALKNWALTMLMTSAVVAGAIYWAHGDILIDRATKWISAAALKHFSALLGLYLAVKAWSYVLDRYLLLYGDNGVVVGAGYTDIHVVLPVLWILVALACLGALISWANIWARSWKLPVLALALVFGSSFVLAFIVPALFERFYVKPNELQLEQPYIEQNIALTREAYNLGHVTVKPFPAEEGLTFQSLQDNRPTIDNIRLWDWRPLMDTYAQLQEIRTYYKFQDVDVDRYDLDGAYQQVTLSARELEPALLPSNAQTWVNLHVLFTHGNGVVMSPVTRKSPEGLPILYLQDIPPIATGGPPIREPRIYFGQATDSYVFVHTSTPEFDYPKGKDNVYASYDGTGGVPIGGTARRSLFAWYFDDPNILLSDYITDESRVMFRRTIKDRVETIAPFLRLDHDPYMVISGGRLFWMQDAYATSSWFPYAPPLTDGGTNYIRNSVKVVIDAYNGDVQFFIVDTADPVIATYRTIFPGLFKSFEAMPGDLKKHVRYPEDLFLIQAQLYRAYHMSAPEVFYNREDLWQFPREVSGVDGRMPPYYLNMRLPGEARTEFFLMLPMVPSQRENMIAWLAARCDAPDYGKLIVYEFPKEKLVYGPFQIEARINQNTEISQQLSLWNQRGSRVIRGNLLVVPIENSILYVSPLYLRAESGQLPELKRVIAAYDDKVVMRETLAQALAALFGETVPASALPSTPVAQAASGSADARAREALDHYDRAMERLKAGDWAGFGTELDALRAQLEQLAQRAAGR